MTTEGNVNRSRLETTIEKYVTEHKHWAKEQYKLEYKGLTIDRSQARVWVIHLDDSQNPKPGVSKSIEVRVRLSDYSVVRELAFQ